MDTGFGIFAELTAVSNDAGSSHPWGASMNNLRRIALAFSCLTLFLAAAFAITPEIGPTSASAAKPLDRKTVLENALKTYYILENQGLKSFQCMVQPDWKKLMDSQAEKPGTEDPRLPMLSPVQYSVAVNNQGDPQISPIRPTGGTPDSSVDGMVAGAQRAILGFFQSWDSIVLSSLFVPSDENSYALSEQPDGYKLTVIAGEQHIEYSLTKDFVLTLMHVTAPGVVISINPKYTKIDKGLLLMTGFDDDINNGSQKVSVQIQYQTIEGFHLPSKVSYQVMFSGQTVPMDLYFTKYQLGKH